MKIPDGENRVHLHTWYQNGCLFTHQGQGERGALPTVSIGRTYSERGLGFLVLNAKTRKERAAFVLDRCQVEDLHAYLGRQIKRLKKTRGCILTRWLATARRQRAAILGRRRARARR
jgi:hypothetical protein